VRARARSNSGFGWAFGVRGPAPVSCVHTLVLSDDFDDEVRAVFDRNEMGKDPTVWVSVPSLVDPARAPPGHHTVFALLYAPATATTTDWAREGPRLRDVVAEKLERRFPGLRSRITTEALVTPRDIARSGSPDGAIYGAAPNGATGTFARPPNRARAPRGLYFAGGATHPGGGVTLAMRSGRFAAELVARDAIARDAKAAPAKRFGTG
jgi:phytoene desaturase